MTEPIKESITSSTNLPDEKITDTTAQTHTDSIEDDEIVDRKHEKQLLRKLDLHLLPVLTLLYLLSFLDRSNGW